MGFWPSGNNDLNNNNNPNNSILVCIKNAVTTVANSLHRTTSHNTSNSNQPPLHNTVTNASVSEVFKCFICLESRPNSYFSCPLCGRYLGCYGCYVNVMLRRLRVTKCPSCRGQLDIIKLVNGLHTINRQGWSTFRYLVSS